MNRWGSVLLWSVIAAAFIGPGTITTAASAGAGHGFALLWALTFSTLACFMLQEAAARVTVASGQDLGQALRRRYGHGLSGALLLGLVLGAIVLGCAAYEAGNILGGVAGAALGTSLDPRWLTLACSLGAAALLFAGAPRTVARSLGAFVALMGVTFLVTAWRLGPSIPELLRGTLVPSAPAGSGLLILGLVGTTVVPYNLFLGSGLARGQALPELRFGLAVSVLLGGIISMGVVVVGSAVDGAFGYEALAEVLALRLGPGARTMFALGLFAAGFSSAVTAPLAAAITTRGLFATPGDSRWADRSWRFRAVWIGVLAVGAGFGLTGIRPVPAIVLAQAFNGVLLPLVAILLLLAVNDRRLMGATGLNRWSANTVMTLVVGTTVVLGSLGVVRAAAATLRFDLPAPGRVVALAAALVLLLGWPVGRALRRLRS